MLTQNEQNIQPEIQRHIQEVLLENTRYRRELRSFHREVLVCPVQLTFSDDELHEQHCVSRNISPAGMSIISSVEFDERITATLEIYRLTDAPKKGIFAECRWCKSFGPMYWMSGWQFIRLVS